ncbi:MAG: restriction endonuclease subunit S, partial [Leptolyngbyaceae cyanobacterium CAN_BIN12]|nr:restriction endonuclease subunit S [Leptolyngbyaceae cyanobacterium CAN_BIN12]
MSANGMAEGQGEGRLPVAPTEEVGTSLVKLGDYCDVLGGKRLPKGYELTSEDTGYPYIRVVDFFNYSIDKGNLKFVPLGAKTQISRYIINNSDIYISIAGTIGLVGQVPTELSGANLTENAARIVIKYGFIPRFLLYQLSSEDLQSQIRNKTIATTQAKLGLFRIKELEVVKPPLPEQRRIAAKLDALLGRVEACRDRLAPVPRLLKRFRQAVLAAATSGELTAEWREDYRNKDAIKGTSVSWPFELSPDDLPNLPDTWLWVKVKTLATKVADGVHKKPIYKDSGIPFITVRNLTAGPQISFQNTSFVSSVD